MIVVGLDLSTKSSGYSIFKDGVLIDYGCISAASADVINRIKKMTGELQDILIDYSINAIVMEEVRPETSSSYFTNMHTQKVLMWLQASIIFMLHDHFPEVTIDYYYPNQWRKVCGIKTGRGIKRQQVKEFDIAFVKDKYNIEVNDDIADAIGIAHAYIVEHDNEINWE